MYGDEIRRIAEDIVVMELGRIVNNTTVRAIYGEAYPMHISSVKGVFTSVEIALPFADPLEKGDGPLVQGNDRR